MRVAQARAGAAECLEGLAQAMVAFSEASAEPSRLFPLVAEHASRLTGDLAVVLSLAEGGAELHAAAMHGPDASLVQKSRTALYRPVALERHPVMRQVLETGLPFIMSQAMLSKLSPPLTTEGFVAWAREVQLCGLLLVPLRVRETSLGMLVFARMAPVAPFSQEDLRYAQGLAVHASLAIANTRELAERRRMAERLKLLSDCARDFASATGDLPALLETIARRIGEQLGDLCAIRALSPDGSQLEPAGAVFHRDPELAAQARAAGVETRRAQGSVQPAQIPRTPIFLPHVTAAEWSAKMGGRYGAVLEKMGVVSAISLPLFCRGELVGKVNLLRCAGGKSYTEDDLRLAQAIADHAGPALGNARSVEAERSARATAEAMQRKLADSEERHRLIFDCSPLPMMIFDVEDKRVVEVNEAASRLYGYSREELCAPGIRERLLAPGVSTIEDPAPGATLRLGLRQHRRKDGSTLHVDVTLHSFVLGGRRVRVVVPIDLSERMSLEEQLRQAQKMEAIGRLAGGVAHDFNNLLSVIGSYGEIASAETAGTPLGDDIEQIQKATARAATLTRQLLMFSRQQMLESKVLDLGALLGGMGPMLQRLVGEDVELHVRAAPQLARVRADPGSLEQVIMNLVVNSRDAMPTGGKLTIEAENTRLDEEYAREHLGVKAGPHVMISVTDSGQGMDRATQQRIFEPFFTTKEKGKGTGLGLSTVFGIVQQSQGHIWVYSEPGQGTTFKIYLPAAEGELEQARPLATLRAQGTETLLVVEDDDLVRAAARRILKRAGYRVLEARGAEEAIALTASCKDRIDLLLTDVVMPQMSGPALAAKLSQERPGLRVLFMSGYTGDSVVRHGLLSPDSAYLAKPLSSESLSQLVRSILDQSREATG